MHTPAQGRSRARTRGHPNTHIPSIESDGQMDTSKKRLAVNSAQVEAQLKVIKDHMPETYKAITEKAGQIGRAAFGFVRHGVAGQANKFYAVERGRVVGTPFDLPGVADEVARVIVQFGCTFLIMWAPEAQQQLTEKQETANGPH